MVYGCVCVWGGVYLCVRVYPCHACVCVRACGLFLPVVRMRLLVCVAPLPPLQTGAELRVRSMLPHASGVSVAGVCAFATTAASRFTLTVFGSRPVGEDAAVLAGVCERAREALAAMVTQ